MKRKCISIGCQNQSAKDENLCRKHVREMRTHNEKAFKEIQGHRSDSLTLDFTGGFNMRWELNRLWNDIIWNLRRLT
jgi:hypothetical protein